MKIFSIVSVITFILTLIGGINWALVGLFDLDLIRKAFGNMSALSRFIYIIIGASTIYFLLLEYKIIW